MSVKASMKMSKSHITDGALDNNKCYSSDTFHTVKIIKRFLGLAYQNAHKYPKGQNPQTHTMDLECQYTVSLLISNYFSSPKYIYLILILFP